MKKLKKYIKTFEGDNRQEVEDKVNEFIKRNDVCATQSHITAINNLVIYTFVCFHDVWEND